MSLIETPRLILRPLEEGDLEAWHSIVSDPITMRFWPAPFTLDQARAWIEGSLRSFREHGFGRCAVISKADNTLIGDCGIFRAEIDGTPENDLGYIFSREVWGHGYATEAAEACKNYGVETLSLRRICANMPADHVASRRVAEKIGMRREREFYNKRNRNFLTYLYAYEVEPPQEESAV